LVQLKTTDDLSDLEWPFYSSSESINSSYYSENVNGTVSKFHFIIFGFMFDPHTFTYLILLIGVRGRGVWCRAGEGIICVFYYL